MCSILYLIQIYLLFLIVWKLINFMRYCQYNLDKNPKFEKKKISTFA